jgi:hypothetical protein
LLASIVDLAAEYARFHRRTSRLGQRFHPAIQLQPRGGQPLILRRKQGLNGGLLDLLD